MYAIVSDDDRCPCGSGDVFSACCAPVLAGDKRAPTAEQLMRSRYTAFALGDANHLRRTWHPSTRPSAVTIDEGRRWVRLDILATTGGGPFDSDGTVHFVANYRTADGRGRQEERSRFVRVEGAWFYLDGVPPAS